MNMLIKTIALSSFSLIVAGCGTTPQASTDDVNSSSVKSIDTTPNDMETSNVNFETKINAKKVTIYNNSSLNAKPYEWLPFGGYQRFDTGKKDAIFIASLNRFLETNTNGSLDEVVVNVMDVDFRQSVTVTDWIIYVNILAMNTVQRTLSCTASINFKFGEKSVRYNLVTFVPKFPVKTLSEIDKDAVPYVNGRAISGVGDCYAVLTEQVAKVINNQAEKSKVNF